MPAASLKWIAGLSPEMPIASACAVIVRARLAAVKERLEQGLEDGDGVEVVHQMRVSSRRCFAALDVLSQWVPDRPQQKLAKQLRRLRRRCGKARDADVQDKFLEELAGQPGRDADQLAGLNELRDRLARRRRKARKKIRRKLPRLADRIRRAGQKLTAAISTAAPGRWSVTDQTPLADVARNSLSTELNAVRRHTTWADDPPETLHPLRIACKRLRYVLEIFIPVLPGVWQEDVYPRLQKMQELLGVIQDGIVGRALFAREATRGRPQFDAGSADAIAGLDTTTSPLSSAIALVQREYADRVAHAHAEFLGLWKYFCEALPSL